MHLSHLRNDIYLFNVTRLMRKIIYSLSGKGNMDAILLCCQQGSQKAFYPPKCLLTKICRYTICFVVNRIDQVDSEIF